MKNKYFILAITFLCLLLGQSSFGQFKSGDQDFAENFGIDDNELAKLIASMDKQLDEIIIIRHKSDTISSEDESDNSPTISSSGNATSYILGIISSNNDCFLCGDNDDNLGYLDTYFEDYFNGPNSGEYGYQGDKTVQHFIPFADGTDDIVTGYQLGDSSLIGQGVFWIALDFLSLGGDRAIFGFIRTGEEIAVPVVKTIENIIKVGDDIGGIIVKNLRSGTNGKFAIIGRKMSSVETAANALINEGKEVELFNEFYQNKKSFYINGENVGWDRIVKEFDTLKSQYGTIPDNILEDSLMYKANKIWAEKIESLGYTIIDIGNPTNEPIESIFYNLETAIIF